VAEIIDTDVTGYAFNKCVWGQLAARLEGDRDAEGVSLLVAYIQGPEVESHFADGIERAANMIERISRAELNCVHSQRSPLRIQGDAIVNTTEYSSYCFSI
jgi:hypothetical protein